MLKSSNTSAFLKFSPQEAILDEWEMMDDSASFHISDVLVLIVLLGVIYLGPRLMARAAGAPLPFLVRTVLFVAPCAYVGWKVASRPKRKGYLCLTNWRCIFFERAEGLVNSKFRVFAADLDDIVGVHTVYEQNVFGTKSLLLVIYTKFEDRMTVRIGDTGGVLSKLPGLGRLFRRSSLGKDAFLAPPILFHRIEQRRKESLAPSPSY